MYVGFLNYLFSYLLNGNEINIEFIATDKNNLFIGSINYCSLVLYSWTEVPK